MKKWSILLLMVSFTLILSACSSKEKQAAGNLKVTKENSSYLAEYDKSLQNFMNEMSTILRSFNDSVDGLYTQEYSNVQFGTAVKDNIQKSNQLIKDVESIDVKPELFEANQNLIVLVNRSHQLLLRAIDMANDEETEIDKEFLRNEYMEIKTQQATIVNQWKILREQLETAPGEQ